MSPSQVLSFLIGKMGIKSDLTKLISGSNKITHLKVLSKPSTCPTGSGAAGAGGVMISGPEAPSSWGRRSPPKASENNQELSSTLRERSHLCVSAGVTAAWNAAPHILFVQESPCDLIHSLAPLVSSLKARSEAPSVSWPQNV